MAPNNNNNPYGLSAPELEWYHGRGAATAERATSLQTLQAERVATQARVDKLQSLLDNGEEGCPRAPLDASFQAGGKFALSDPEQQWAMGGPTSSDVTLSLQDELAEKQLQLDVLQQQLMNLQKRLN